MVTFSTRFEHSTGCSMHITMPVSPFFAPKAVILVDPLWNALPWDVMVTFNWEFQKSKWIDLGDEKSDRPLFFFIGKVWIETFRENFFPTQKLSLKNMDTILFWTLILIGSALFVYLVPYKNIKIIQKLQRESLQKLDTIIELLKKKN